jgi:hypothetical protein
VVLQIAIERSPAREEITRARESCRRRSRFERGRQVPAAVAYYVVTLADKVLEDENRKFEASGGKQGVEKREKVKQFGDGDKATVVGEDPAGPCSTRQGARRVQRTHPVDRDPQKNGLLYAFSRRICSSWYGDFETPRKRFQRCTTCTAAWNEWGYKAWEKLISMTTFEGDAAAEPQAAEAKSCAYDAETAEGRRKHPHARGSRAWLPRARKLYEEAEKMAERSGAVTRSGAMASGRLKVALDSARTGDEAPEAAMNGAFAVQQSRRVRQRRSRCTSCSSRVRQRKRSRSCRRATRKPPPSRAAEKYESA